jgi:hypothetical protein
MIRIDNRLILPFVTPFLFLFLIQALCWFAEATPNPNLIVVISFMLGVFIGALGSLMCFDFEIDLGHITIGKKKP